MRRSLVAFLAFVLAASAASAQPRRDSNPPPQAKEQPPVLFTADEVQYDDELGLVVAKGNVEISQENTTLLADTVTYNRRSDTITASGHVTLFEPTGEIVFADFIELTNRMNDGFIQNLRMLLTDRSRLAANTGRRTNGVHTELRRGVYSPCDLCREDPTRPPLWQLRAAEITHDEETHVIEYRDAVLELGGFPVLYTPYLSHPDPTVKRQSGFLTPTLGSSNLLGAHFSVPYFWAIAPDKDFTFRPTFTTDAGIVAAGEYRQRFGNGELTTDASITHSNLEEGATAAGPTTGKEAWRGHLFGTGRFDLTDTWRTGFDVQRVTDQTYLRRYGLPYSGNTFLTSRAFAEGFEPRSYTAATSYLFQSQVAGTQDTTLPIILPVADYSWSGEPGSWGERWSVAGNILNLYRERGTDSRRLSLGTEMQLPFSDAIGGQYTLTASVRGDAYYSTDLQNTPTDPTRDAFDGRLFPQFALEWRYPWVRRGGSYSELIEPIAAVIAGPVGGNSANIPNNDSLDFDFDDTDLFVRNRFPGLDRVDTGQRVDYGLRGGVYGDGGGSTRFLVGQSYRFQENTPFPRGLGLDDRLSDIVGRVIVSPGSYLDVYYRFRMDKDNLSLRRQEVGFRTGTNALRVTGNYLSLPPALTDVPPVAREQIVVGVNAMLTQYWGVQLSTTRTLSGDTGTLNSSVGVFYQDECLTFIASLTQSGTRDRDITPGTALLFTVVFKNLGEFAGPSIQ